MSRRGPAARLPPRSLIARRVPLRPGAPAPERDLLGEQPHAVLGALAERHEARRGRSRASARCGIWAEPTSARSSTCAPARPRRSASPPRSPHRLASAPAPPGALLGDRLERGPGDQQRHRRRGPSMLLCSSTDEGRLAGRRQHAARRPRGRARRASAPGRPARPRHWTARATTPSSRLRASAQSISVRWRCGRRLRGLAAEQAFERLQQQRQLDAEQQLGAARARADGDRERVGGKPGLGGGPGVLGSPRARELDLALQLAREPRRERLAEGLERERRCGGAARP